MSCDQDLDELIFYVNGKKVVTKHADPEVLLLSYLRRELRLTGTKYGCGAGGCGACTVMVSTIHPVSKKILHYPATACLLPICSLHGMAITTVEGIGNSTKKLHPVQERLAKAHGSQCGFCSPGMVMSIYSLLRNNPEPTIEDIMEYLSGNLCRCTGYRPILDGFKTFDKSPKLFNQSDLLPLDPTQELIFPPELMLMLNKPMKTSTYRGERVIWHSVPTLPELLEMTSKFPKAPLVVGNTNIGVQMNIEGIVHPVIISPMRIPELYSNSTTDKGLLIGAAVTLSQLKQILQEDMSKSPQDKTKIYKALLQQLKTLAGEQIRSMASLGGHIISRGAKSDLNPVLAVGGAMLNLVSKGGSRTIPMNDAFFTAPSALNPGEILQSVLIPYSTQNQFVSAYRQAQREENAAAIVNAGMQVTFNDGTDVIKDISICYGGIGSTTMYAKNTCKALIGRNWNDAMLSEACSQILKEITIPPSAPEGKVEFKRSMSVSFFFKFHIDVMQSMKKTITSVKAPEYISAIKDFEKKVPMTSQIFQHVNAKQPMQDPVGRPVVHQSAIKQATGEAIYVDDMPAMDQELFIVFVTSKRAYAKIVSIDDSDALKSPGVFDMIRAKDVTGVNEVSGQGPLFSEQEVITVGQIICAIVADTPEHAKRAAAKVKINYEDKKPLIITVEDAITYNSFFEPFKQIEQGNVEEAFKKAAQILEGEVHIGGQEHFYMETHCVRVVPKGEDEYDIYISTQDPTGAQLSVAAALGVPSNKITCYARRTGGAFGGKVFKPAIFASGAGVAAQKTRRPIRCALERNEDMLMTAGRHPLKAVYKVGFMNDGEIVALDISLYANAGCTPDESILLIVIAVLKMDNAYHFPNFKCVAKACKTNLPSNTAFRGFGFPQSGMAIENILAAVALKLGLPATRVRERNMYKGIAKTFYKQPFDSTNLMLCWNECLQKSSYVKRLAEIQKFNSENYWKKKGMDIIPLKFTVGFIEKAFHQASALCHIYRDGKVLISHGGVEMGQGIHTKITQIASRELNIPISYIYISGTSTAAVANSVPSGGSIGTDVYGLAVKIACQTLMERLAPYIKQQPDGKWENWVLAAFFDRTSLTATGHYRGYETDMDWEKGQGNPAPYYIYGASCSEIELDCLTGAHKNLRTDIVVDFGESINPAIDIGQIEGGFLQGSGLYGREELFYSPQGDMHTLGSDKYWIPALRDVPIEFNVSLLASSKNPFTIYSSKGTGEAGVFMATSEYFAMKSAVDAVREQRGLSKIFSLNCPLTPEKIRMACEDELTKMIPTDEPGTFIPWSIPVTK